MAKEKTPGGKFLDELMKRTTDVIIQAAIKRGNLVGWSRLCPHCRHAREEQCDGDPVDATVGHKRMRTFEECPLLNDIGGE